MSYFFYLKKGQITALVSIMTVICKKVICLWTWWKVLPNRQNYFACSPKIQNKNDLLRWTLTSVLIYSKKYHENIPNAIFRNSKSWCFSFLSVKCFFSADICAHNVWTQWCKRKLKCVKKCLIKSKIHWYFLLIHLIPCALFYLPMCILTE